MKKDRIGLKNFSDLNVEDTSMNSPRRSRSTTHILPGRGSAPTTDRELLESLRPGFADRIDDSEIVESVLQAKLEQRDKDIVQAIDFGTQLVEKNSLLEEQLEAKEAEIKATALYFDEQLAEADAERGRLELEIMESKTQLAALSSTCSRIRAERNELKSLVEQLETHNRMLEEEKRLSSEEKETNSWLRQKVHELLDEVEQYRIEVEEFKKSGLPQEPQISNRAWSPPTLPAFVSPSSSPLTSGHEGKKQASRSGSFVGVQSTPTPSPTASNEDSDEAKQTTEELERMHKELQSAVDRAVHLESQLCESRQSESHLLSAIDLLKKEVESLTEAATQTANRNGELQDTVRRLTATIDQQRQQLQAQADASLIAPWTPSPPSFAPPAACGADSHSPLLLLTASSKNTATTSHFRSMSQPMPTAAAAAAAKSGATELCASGATSGLSPLSPGGLILGQPSRITPPASSPFRPTSMYQDIASTIEHSITHEQISAISFKVKKCLSALENLQKRLHPSWESNLGPDEDGSPVSFSVGLFSETAAAVIGEQGQEKGKEWEAGEEGAQWRKEAWSSLQEAIEFLSEHTEERIWEGFATDRRLQKQALKDAANRPMLNTTTSISAFCQTDGGLDGVGQTKAIVGGSERLTSTQKRRQENVGLCSYFCFFLAFLFELITLWLNGDVEKIKSE